MGDFGSINWKLFEKFLLESGCVLKRIKGDHRIYAKGRLPRPLVVPQYDPLPPHIVMNNLRVLDIKKEVLLEFLKRG